MSASPLVKDKAQDDAIPFAAAEPFSGLPEQVLKMIGDIAEPRQYQAGETIFAAGQYDGAEFFFIVKGRVKSSVADPASGAVIIEDIGENGFFGLFDAVAGEDAPQAEHSSLYAETDCALLAIGAEEFRALAARRPLLMRSLATYFARILARARHHLAPQEITPQRRVFAALLEYVERDAVSGEWRVPRMPKHRELAERAGADEASTAAAIAYLIQEGVARRDYPGLVIDDMAQLDLLSK